MYNRLIDFLETYKILVKLQFSFRKFHSTYMALMTLMAKSITALENGEHVIGIVLDFSKAFDTVDHEIWLKRCTIMVSEEQHTNGFRATYQTENSITYNGICSSTKDVKCGVPQGSILGPMLFLMYINDLCSIYKYTTPILFADDTNLFSSGKDLKVIENRANDELSNISEWLKVNKLSLNINKTHYMIFSQKKNHVILKWILW